MRKTGSEKADRQAERGRKQNRYWLVWAAAGCGVGSLLPHVMV
jgi:hypothetical protein